ncbi:hypothetical protein F5X68DRAFT_258580 [Plectosphaerella plurivora]|uniref:Uncharacterized protein n=1 Tax=Plectosphaerella plurivora TaxID=936078 RepID=A0A9P9AFJ5_9PEZI|nr:hypothetical protein F5X68DRAFT_258580 [Plectosphaerella plurivora]
MLVPCTLLFIALLLAVMVVIFSLPHGPDTGWAGARCPENASCTGGSLASADGEPGSIHDYVFNASAGDKIWRGFLLGCAVGLFVAALFCCWAPCFRFGARGAAIRAWRYPWRVIADAESGGGRDTRHPEDVEVAESRRPERERTTSGRFVDQAALAAVAY